MAYALHLVLWVCMVISIGVLAGALLDLCLSRFLKNGYHYSKGTFYSAYLIQIILHIADALNQEPIENPHLAHVYRRQIIRALYDLSRVAQGPWVKYCKTQYGLIGPNIAQCGSALSLTLCEWIVELEFAEDTAHLALCASDVLKLAATGQWNRISPAGEYVVKVRSGRILRIFRRLLSICVAIGIALVSYVYFRQLMPHFYLQAIIISCLGFATAQLFTALDSNSTSAIDNATKIGQLFHR